MSDRMTLRHMQHVTGARMPCLSDDAGDRRHVVSKAVTMDRLG